MLPRYACTALLFVACDEANAGLVAEAQLQQGASCACARVPDVAKGADVVNASLVQCPSCLRPPPYAGEAALRALPDDRAALRLHTLQAVSARGANAMAELLRRALRGMRQLLPQARPRTLARYA